jgi:hypothetical protein
MRRRGAAARTNLGCIIERVKSSTWPDPDRLKITHEPDQVRQRKKRRRQPQPRVMGNLLATSLPLTLFSLHNYSSHCVKQAWFKYVCWTNIAFSCSRCG